MAEMAWPDDLGHGTFTGRFGWMDADGVDEGVAPDITAATGGTVEITPSVATVRYTGANGPLSLVARRAVGVIDGEGYLCTKGADGEPGPRGMSFPATDNDALSPSGWTYRVVVKFPDGVTLPAFSTVLATGATVDLATAIPVDASPGVVKIVDDTIAVRAEAAAGRAEQAAADVEANIDQIVADYLATAPDLRGEPGPDGRGIASISDPDADSRVTIVFTDGSTATVQAIRGADGHTPAITWEGTSIVVDGAPGPDLKGEPGADSTVPGPAPNVSWDGDRLVVEGVAGPSLTGPGGPAPTVAWSGDRLVVGGVQGPSLTGPASTVPGPPGAVPTSTDYVVVGPGRPDVPAGTGYTSAQLAALPVGAEYRSADGANVGAWVWSKRPSGWVVTDGDTGIRTLVGGSDAGPWKIDKIQVWRSGSEVHFYFEGGSAIDSPAGTIGAQPPIWDVPPGWRSSTPGIVDTVYSDLNAVGTATIYNSASIKGQWTAGPWRRLNMSWHTNDPWPATLPGSAT